MQIKKLALLGIVALVVVGFAGHDAVWSYDSEQDLAFGDDGMFSVVRPTTSVDGVTIID